MVGVDVHVSSHLKEELAWAADKQLQVMLSLFKIQNNIVYVKSKPLFIGLLVFNL